MIAGVGIGSVGMEVEVRDGIKVVEGASVFVASCDISATEGVSGMGVADAETISAVVGVEITGGAA